LRFCWFLWHISSKNACVWYDVWYSLKQDVRGKRGCFPLLHLLKRLPLCHSNSALNGMDPCVQPGMGDMKLMDDSSV
jgi:hypothetical protein